MTTVTEVLQRCSLPRRDVEVILQHVLSCDRAWLISHGDDPLGDDQARAVEGALGRRERGEPVAYITGRREFWSLDLTVSSAVLIPRPDTESLVAWATELVPGLPIATALDLGTGSGAIALALKHTCPDLAVTAVDISSEALAVAQDNADRHRLEVKFVEGDWFGPLEADHWSLIVSNPPYIAANDPHLTAGDLRAEPEQALVAGADGLDAIRQLLAAAPRHLDDGGWLLIEHGFDQGPAVRRLFAEAGFSAIATRCDLDGRERVTGGMSRAR